MIEVLRVERRSLYLHLHVHINRGPIVVELTIRSLIFERAPAERSLKKRSSATLNKKIAPLAAQNFAK